MNTPLLIWSCTVLTIILTAAVKSAISAHRLLKKNNTPFIQIGSEREEFFVPGDPLTSEEIENED